MDPVSTGTNRTLEQLRVIKDSSAFICAGTGTAYVRCICLAIGGKYNVSEDIWHKPDKSVIHIYSRRILSYARIDRLRGRYFREVVIDHSIQDTLELGTEESDCLRKAYERVRGEDYFSMNRSALKCIIKDCTNKTNEGSFVGNLCAVCNDMVQKHHVKSLCLVAQAPIPMHIYCPMCHTQHIDEGEWATRPHHTHSCQTCGHTWRPAVVCTTGVQFLPGFKDAAPASRKIQPVGAPFHKFNIVKAMRDADVLGCVPVVSEWHCGEIMEAVEAMYPAATGFRDLVKKELPF